MSMLLGLIAFIDAQGGWWDGAEITNSQLLGLEVRWWARIGKALQLLAGLVIIIEIIGLEGLRRFMTKVGAYDLHEARRRIQNEHTKHIERMKLIKEIKVVEEFHPRLPVMPPLYPSIGMVKALEYVEQQRFYRETEEELEQKIRALDPERRAAFASAKLIWRLGMIVLSLLYILVIWGIIVYIESPGYSGLGIILSVVGVMITAIIIIATTMAALWVSHLIAMVVLSARNSYALILTFFAFIIVKSIGLENPGNGAKKASLLLFIIGSGLDILGS